MRIQSLKRLFCYHKWIQIGNPYLWEGGMTKRVDVRCIKCNKLSNVDIFDTPKRRKSYVQIKRIKQQIRELATKLRELED